MMEDQSEFFEDYPGAKWVQKHMEVLNAGRMGRPCCIMDTREPPLHGRFLIMSAMGLTIVTKSADRKGKEKFHREASGVARVTVPWPQLQRVCQSSGEKLCSECEQCEDIVGVSEEEFLADLDRMEQERYNKCRNTKGKARTDRSSSEKNQRTSKKSSDQSGD